MSSARLVSGAESDLKRRGCPHSQPVETSQLPMFRLLGTPKEHKRRVLYKTGHNIPRTELIKESLDWLDRYLSPVRRKE
jgi:hypothetical protein